MRSRYGLAQVVRSELIKISTLRSTLWTLLIAVAGTVGVAALAANSSTHHGASYYQNFDPTNQSLAGLALAALAVGVFGVMAFTGEYGGGTIRPSLAAIPDRRLLLAGKLIVVAATTLVVGEALSFLSFGVGQAILRGGGAPTAGLGQPGVLRAVMLSGVLVALLGLLGLALGVIIRATAGAVSAYVGIVFLLPVVLQRLPGHEMRYSPLSILANSVASVIRDPIQMAPLNGLLLVVAYCAALLAAGSVLMLGRDA